MQRVGTFGRRKGYFLEFSTIARNSYEDLVTAAFKDNDSFKCKEYTIFKCENLITLDFEDLINYMEAKKFSFEKKKLTISSLAKTFSEFPDPESLHGHIVKLTPHTRWMQ